jgi:predicted helicase
MAKVFHAHLHGLSTTKDKALLTLDIVTTKWLDIDLDASGSYLLIPQSCSLKKEYNQGWKITDIMRVNSVAIVTGQDSKTISIEKMDAGSLATSHGLPASKVTPILYRPFDVRHIVYDSNVITRSRIEVMQHMLAGENLGLTIGRQGQAVNQSEWNIVFCSDSIVEFNLYRRGGNNLFPLYLYPTTSGEIEMGIARTPNISDDFLAKIKLNTGYIPSPETIFYYIYAICHSPKYRDRYAEFLKGDFPRIPITRDVDLFHQLGELGEELVDLHLMKSPILNQTSSPFIDNGGGCIVDAGHPKYESGKVVINKQKDGFMDVPEAVWNFHVGGYQVCQKWLKDRKGRTLSQDDIRHYQKIVVALGQSIELMAKIDAAIPSWPLDAEYN